MQRYSPAPRHRRRLILELLDDIPFKSVLDVGCGRGMLLNMIDKKHDVNLAGSDISKVALDLNARDYPNISFFQLNIMEEALSERFDVVICSEVLEHLQDYREPLHNLLEMTSRYLIATVPVCPLFQSDINMGHMRHFEGQELREVIESQGFSILCSLKWGYPFFNAYKHALNGVGSTMIHEAFARTDDYGFKQKFVCQLLYYLFFMNFKSHPKGYQLLIVAEKSGNA